MKTLLIYGPGDENCKQTLVHLLLDRLERYSLLQTEKNSLYTSVVSEPVENRSGPYADSRALHLIKITAAAEELIESIRQGALLADGSDGLIILGQSAQDYPQADLKIAVPKEGDNTAIDHADFIYRLREDLDDLIARINDTST